MTNPVKYKLNAVIIKSGRVISIGTNSTGTFFHGIEKGSRELWNINRCAEKDAILKALKMYDGLSHLAGATIYVSRLGKRNSPLLAKPCKHCMEFIKSVGIKKIEFTTSIGTEVINLR